MREGAPRLIKIITTTARNPAQMISIINERNITTFFSILRKRGIKVAFSNMFRVINNSISDIERISNLDGVTIEVFTGERIEVPCSENPLVSVVIPVYNQFEYTYWCVRSIVETTKNIDYEIIIADDCSNDLTLQIDDYLPGIRLIRNETNLKFTLNCNNAIKNAKGKYVILLNNDTIVTENWMQSLIDTIEGYTNVGIVGSKLVYPDGILQEAGCIIWQDGTAWNVGKGSNPNLPEYNYLKEADYVSAASLMIPKTIWDEVGGFDERYAPSYCEDSDLAFKVREYGYKVLYQPKSKAIHFEGMTNGKTTNSKLKSHQLINIQKFCEKWEYKLHYQHPVGSDFFIARDRSGNKKCIVFIDDSITDTEGDDYDRYVVNAITEYAKNGLSVKLIPDNYIYDEDNAPYYQDMGVEVLYGGRARKDGKKWIRDCKKYVDQVIICRPLLINKYSKLFRESNIRFLHDEYLSLLDEQRIENPQQ